MKATNQPRVWTRIVAGGAAVWLIAFLFAQRPQAIAQLAHPSPGLPGSGGGALFLPSSECLACHNGLTTPDGEDVSIGVSWRASMMANSSRDPYWQAGVRREVMDHPAAAREIEDECSICHMPMSRTQSRAAGGHGEIFAHLPIGDAATPDAQLAADGVGCTVCHQIGPERLGTRESFTGGFVIAPRIPAGDSEVCATCHTLYTQALGPKGEALGELPEQVPYLEWRRSAFAGERSCQGCHMPEVTAEMPITSVLGVKRAGLSRHTFVGGNFFMLRMLNRYRTRLGVEALPQELEAAARATLEQLRRDTASLTIERAGAAADRLALDVTVRNLTGHKLPTAYPSRRAWLHLTVRDRDDRVVFSSGAIERSGLIRGNDNDTDAEKFEPHYTEITSEDQVQIYESVMRDVEGGITTGLLRATAYAKDNRLLPRGFDKASAVPDIAVRGAARDDGDFTGERDRIRYVVDTAGRQGPFRVDVELRYQPIGFRWAQNLRAYEAPETQRFVTWFDEMSSGSSALLAHAWASFDR